MKKYFDIFRSSDNKKQLIYSEVVIGFICFMFFVFAPFEIYLSAKSEFFFEGYELISFFALCLGASFIVLSLVNVLSIMISRKLHHIFGTIIFSLGVAFYIQGNYILADYGVLDGTTINWENYKTEGIISNGLFIVLLIIGIILLKKIEVHKYMKYASGISVCIILVQIVTLMTLFFTNGGLEKEQVYISTTEGEFTYSSKENMFILMLDTFDARVMNELLQGEDAETCKEILKDFTFYPNTASVYSSTYFSIPQVLTGVEVTEDTLYTDYIDKAYELEGNRFYQNLKDRNWDCRMYSDTQLPSSSKEVVFENWNKYTLKVTSHRRLGTYMIKLIGFRYMPQCFKEYFWFYSDDIKGLIDIESDTEDIFSWENLEFYDGIDTIDVENEEGVFAFYHLEGTHLPFYTNRDMVNTKNDVGINEEGLAMMTMVDKFCSKLRELGIYDNSVIVVMADHGHYDYRQNPVFMVKGIEEDHVFMQDDGCFTFADIQETWCNLLAGMPAKEAVVINADNGQRRFFEVHKKQRLSEIIIEKNIADARFTGKTLNVEWE